MTPRALQASAVTALVVFAVFTALLFVTVSRSNYSATTETGYNATDHAIKPTLVGL